MKNILVNCYFGGFRKSKTALYQDQHFQVQDQDIEVQDLDRYSC